MPIWWVLTRTKQLSMAATFSTPELLFFTLAARPKSSAKLRARVAKSWLYGLQSACPAVQNQNGRAASLKPCKSWKYSDFCLKDEQKTVIEAVVCKKRDVLGALPTGFARSFYLSFAKWRFRICWFKRTSRTRERKINHSRNFSTKCPDARPDKYHKARAIGAIILDSTKKSIDLASMYVCPLLRKENVNFCSLKFCWRIITKQCWKWPNFRKNVRFIVVDQAHLMNEWWLLLFSWISFVMSCYRNRIFPGTSNLTVFIISKPCCRW